MCAYAKISATWNKSSFAQLFKRRQCEDPCFFYSIQVDQYNCMTNFLRDNRSKLAYDWFVDAICFDNTFCTNKYNLICALFAGINHHSKNVLFGYAFLYDEIIESFIWLFETFLETMENKQPKCIFTNKDKAMSNANEIVFSETCQQLCIWHFAKNARQQFATYYTRPELKQYYNNCFYGCSNIATS